MTRFPPLACKKSHRSRKVTENARTRRLYPRRPLLGLIEVSPTPKRPSPSTVGCLAGSSKTSCPKGRGLLYYIGYIGGGDVALVGSRP